jgi:hypothetical protein
MGTNCLEGKSDAQKKNRTGQEIPEKYQGLRNAIFFKNIKNVSKRSMYEKSFKSRLFTSIRRQGKLDWKMEEPAPVKANGILMDSFRIRG